jgi:hypothetical protein
LFVYSTETFNLIKSFSSTAKLSIFLNVNATFGGQIVKLIQTSSYCAAIYKEYIISLTPHSDEVLSASLGLFPVKKEAVIRRGSSNVIIYGFYPSTNEYKT